MRWAAIVALLAACRAAAPEPFHCGIYNVPAERLDDVKKAGFTLIVGPPWRDRATLDRAHALGLKIIMQGLETIEPHPAIIGWYLFDEPDLNGKTPDEMKAIYDDFKRRAPAERGFLTVWNPLRYRDYFKHCDILAPDPYPIRAGTDDVKDALAKVGVCVELARTMAGDRPVWAVLPSFTWAPEFPRMPTMEEARVMAWLAVCKGASAIVWFQYADIADKPEMWQILSILNNNLMANRPVMTDPDTGETVWSGDGSVVTTTRRLGDEWMAIVINADRVARPGRLALPDGRVMETTLDALEVRFLGP